MAIKVSRGGGGNFTPHPEGQYVATCIDVNDLGKVRSVWNGNERMVHKVDLYFFAGEWKTLEDGSEVPLLVRERFTASLHEKAKLRPFVEKIYRKLSDVEADDFDLETLIGMGAMIEVVHRDADGTTYANIDSIMRLPKGAQLPPIPTDYVRVKDRPPRDSHPAQQQRKPDAIDELARQARRDNRVREPEPVPPGDDLDLPF